MSIFGGCEMTVKIVDHITGQELLLEHEWHEQIPHVGDILELHCGKPERWKVTEVDWVFMDTPPEKHEDVPVQYALVKVSPADEVEHKEKKQRICLCGHPEDWHSAWRCIGAAGTCPCKGFKEKKEISI